MSTKALLLRPDLGLVDVLTELMQVILILSVLALPIELLSPDWRFPLYPLLVAATILTYLIRKMAKHIWQYIVLAVILLILPLYLPILPAFLVDFKPKLILGVSLAFLIGRSFYLRILHQTKAAPIGDLGMQTLVLLIMVGLNIIAIRFELMVLSQVYFYLSVIYLVMALVRWHWASLSNQMERFRVMPTQPIARIIRFNKILLAGYIAGAAVLLILSPVLHLHDLVPWLGQLLLAALRWLVSLMSRSTPTETTPETVPSTEPTESQPIFPVDTNEPARWLLILQEIIYYMVLVAAVAALLGLLIYLLYRIYKRFYESNQPDSDKRESLLPNITSQVLERLDRTRNRWLAQFGQSPEQKIRRLYYKLIDSQIHHGLDYKSSLTARQMVDRLNHEKYPELATLTQLYELARYGSNACSVADVTRMQAIYRSLYRQDLTVPERPERKSKEST